mmetsp:Transcript_27597/g.82444  ORF Transcript_27597/g.82444 Transcript_27597/m.82444 type:complete len:251 (+) Transcript_27597:3294-4046(+)
MRAVGRLDVRPRRRRRGARRLPRRHLLRRLLLRGRARLGQGLGRDDQVRRAALCAVRGLPQPARRLLARRLQRLPADGAAWLGARRRAHPGGGAAALRAQLVWPVRVALERRQGRSFARRPPPGHGGLEPGRVGRPRRGTRALPARGLAAGRAQGQPGSAPVHQRRLRGDAGVPAQPQRLPRGHRRPLLARRAPPRHDAAPRALLRQVAMSVGAARVGGERVGAVAPPLPERRRLLRIHAVVRARADCRE